MRTLIVYDSVYGNTERIAKAIGEAVTGEHEVHRPTDLPSRPERFDLLIVGSPTLGGRPSDAIQAFLSTLPEELVKDVRVAAFDTRYSGRFVKMFGFASERIAEALTKKGGRLAAAAEGFIVQGKKGPLKDGELERAVSWAKSISQ